MQLLRRGGHPARPKVKPSQVDSQVEAIRKEQAAKLAANVAEGQRQKARRETKPPREDEARQDTRAGWLAPPPSWRTSTRRRWRNHSAPSFRARRPRVGLPTTRPQPRARHGSTLVTADPTRRIFSSREVEGSSVLPRAEGLLGTYLRNRILNLQGRSATPGDVQGFLEQAIVEGSPELASAATAFLEDHPGDRVGSTTGKGVLGPLRWVEGVGSGTFTWSSHSWDVRDFGDQLPDFLPELLSADGPRPATEPRQCLFLHAAAGLLLHRRGDIPDLGSVRREAALLQRDMHRQATACADALGPKPAEQTQAEVDLRVFLHDAVYFGHDKDYRCLAALPPEAASQVTLCMVRLDQWGRVTCEAIQGISSASGPEEVVWLLVHQGHMRLLCPAGPVPLPSPVRYVAAAGWEAHLEAAVASGALSKPKTVPACPRCTSDSQRRTGLPVGVFGLYPPPDHGPVASASQCRAGLASWEAAEPDQASWTRADLAAFFAPQPLPDGPLDFLEVYAGEARASAAVRARGGTALSVGLDHGHDLNQGVARSKVRAALRLLAPRHLWLSWPCTAFCGWSHLNALRSPDHAASLRLGRHHLRFSTSLAAAQLAAARHVSAGRPGLPGARARPPRPVYHRSRRAPGPSRRSRPAVPGVPFPRAGPRHRHRGQRHVLGPPGLAHCACGAPRGALRARAAHLAPDWGPPGAPVGVGGGGQGLLRFGKTPTG